MCNQLFSENTKRHTDHKPFLPRIWFFKMDICKIGIKAYHWIYLPTTQIFCSHFKVWRWCHSFLTLHFSACFYHQIIPLLIKMANCPTWLNHERTSIWSAGWVMMAYNFITICCSGVGAQQETTYGLKGSGFEGGWVGAWAPFASCPFALQKLISQWCTQACTESTAHVM